MAEKYKMWPPYKYLVDNHIKSYIAKVDNVTEENLRQVDQNIRDAIEDHRQRIIVCGLLPRTPWCARNACSHDAEHLFDQLLQFELRARKEEEKVIETELLARTVNGISQLVGQEYFLRFDDEPKIRKLVEQELQRLLKSPKEVGKSDNVT